MPVFRFLAAVCLLVATIALVDDATPAVYGAGPFHATSLDGHWKSLAPSSFEAAKVGLSGLSGPWPWDNIVAPLLTVPTYIGFTLLAVLLGYLGRRRRSVEIFTN